MNKCQLIGRLTSDPDLKNANGKSVTSFILAVDRFKDSTDFIPCVAWEKKAETIANYVHKGDRLAVAGRIQIRNYETQQGEKRSVTEVVVEDIDLIQPKRDQNEQGTRQNPKVVENFDDFVPF